MKKQLKSDLALKIFSVVIAVCLWFYVVQVQSPDIDRVIKGVPVVFTQKNVLEEKNLILLNDNEHTIDIKIRGSRKYVMDVNSENLTVLADVSNIETTGRHIVFTNIVLPYANLEVINKNPSMLSVDVDDLVTVEKPVEVLTEGTPKDSYMVGNLTANPQKVTIRGPKTIIDGIKSVAAVVDVDGKTADTAGMEPVRVLGTNDKEIKSQLLTFSTAEIEVRTEILKTRTVELEPSFTESFQEMTEQYILDESSIREVKIAGAQALVDSLTAVKTKSISASDLNANGEVTVKLELPPGVRSLDGDSFTLRFSKKLPPAPSAGNR
ncbi:MAG: YbbR-like domain-containing protein [Clostridia bacterium]